MKSLGEIYGVYSFLQWERRKRDGDIDGMRNLSDTRERAGEPRSQLERPITSYLRLFGVISFLSVMNKRLTLLYRGQSADHRLLPTILRDSWTLPDGRKAILTGNRLHYWRQLESMEEIVYSCLDVEGLPRWRHLRYRRPSRWAVIQHYELWPTPLIDVSGSLRVAATFALGFDIACSRRDGAFLYVVGVRDIVGDLMDRRRPDATSTLVMRLNSVCPPNAQRPHLQQGFLVGHDPFGSDDIAVPELSDASSLLVAKFPLRDEGSFWSVDFPPHTRRSLLPPQEHDRLRSTLLDRLKYDMNGDGLATVAAA